MSLINIQKYKLNTIKQIEDIIGIEAKNAIKISAKTGEGIEDLLNLLVKNLPAPEGIDENPLQVFVIDSWYDKYLGVITLVRIKDGSGNSIGFCIFLILLLLSVTR